jgi:hypothetical protein
MGFCRNSYSGCLIGNTTSMCMCPATSIKEARPLIVGSSMKYREWILRKMNGHDLTLVNTGWWNWEVEPRGSS